MPASCGSLPIDRWRVGPVACCAAVALPERVSTSPWPKSSAYGSATVNAREAAVVAEVDLLRSILPEQTRPQGPERRVRLWLFFDLIGRERVVVLYELGVELPSDINGLVHTELDVTGGWRLKLARIRTSNALISLSTGQSWLRAHAAIVTNVGFPKLGADDRSVYGWTKTLSDSVHREASDMPTVTAVPPASLMARSTSPSG